MRWLLATLACLCLPSLGHAQAIDRGREADVLRLLLPYVDEGAVGAGGKLSRIAIRPDAIELDVTDPQGRAGSLRLTPRPAGDAAPGSKSFRIDAPAAPTPPLAESQQLLRAAIDHNDDGSFFARAAALPVKRPAQVAAPPPAALQWAMLLDGPLWLALLALLAVRAWRQRAPGKWLLWLAFAGIAALVRRQVPFAPLHANGHGLEEILVAIGDPDAQAATTRFIGQYGPTWLTPLRWLTRLMGQNHDQLAVVASALGGLAAAFSTAAAWRLSRQWLWTALAAAVVVFVPVATRVGHSESTFVLAQLLVAIGLWLATHEGLLAKAALLVTLLLLTLGHPIGIGLAAGVYLLALAVAAESADWRPVQQVPVLLLLAAAVALQLTMTQAGVTDRLTYAAQFHIPVPTVPSVYWLWLQPGYAPRLAMLAAIPGLWAFGRGRAGWRRWGVLTLATAGTLLVAMSGLMVVACVTDGLRYQAPFAAVLAVLLARAGQGLRMPVFGRMAAVVLWLGIAVGLFGLTEGRRLDAQGQAYQVLRAAVADQRGDVWLATLDRGDGHERVVVQLPAGRVNAAGPVLRPLLVEDLHAACEAHRALPQQAYVWLDSACSAEVPAGQAAPCEALLPYVGESVAAAHIAALPAPGRAEGMPGEFGKYPVGGISLRLARVVCP